MRFQLRKPAGQGRLITHVYNETNSSWISMARLSAEWQKDKKPCTLFQGTLVVTDIHNVLNAFNLDPENNMKVLQDLFKRDVFDKNVEASVPARPTPVSIRDGSLFEKHMIDATRGLVKQFKYPLYLFVRMLEIVFRPFPLFKPSSLYYKVPVFHYGNHLNVVTDGEEVPYPSFCEYLDYEFEIAAVIGKTVRNASEKEVIEQKVVAGYVLFNDFSVRNMQIPEAFAKFGFEKTKSFCNSLSSVFVTPDEIKLEKLSGRVVLNDKEICLAKPENPMFTVSELVAYASLGTALHAGEYIGLGTIPGCSGIEKGVQLRPGDRIELSMDPFLPLTNTIGTREVVQEGSWKKPATKNGTEIPKCLIFVGVVIAVIAIVFVFVFRTELSPVAHNLQKPPSLMDFSAPIYNIHYGEKIPGTLGGESIEIGYLDKQKVAFTGTADGKVVAINLVSLEVTTVLSPSDFGGEDLEECGDLSLEAKCGRVLGLALGYGDSLLIANAYFGVFSYDLRKKELMLLTNGYNGVPFRCVNGIAARDANYGGVGLSQAHSEFVYFTDSTIYPRKDHMKDIFESRLRGALYRYDIKNDETELLYEGIGFANGLAIAGRDRLFVVETTRYRILEFHNFFGPRPIPEPKVFNDNLPCIPDNIHFINGELWVGCAQRIPGWLSYLDGHPSLRWAIAKIPGFFRYSHKLKKPEGDFLVLSDKGEIKRIGFESHGNVVKWISDVQPINGEIWIGSVYSQDIVRIKPPWDLF